MNREEACAYIAAFIDGEGHIGCHMTSRNRSTKTIEFCNTDRQLFDRVVELGLSVGLHFRVYHTKSKREKWSDKSIAYLAGGRAAFSKFAQLIPLQCQRKVMALDELIHSYVDDDQLEAIYASRRTSIKCQCKTCKRDFFVFPADIKRGNGVYCNRECAAIGRSTKQKIMCKTCGLPFMVMRCRANKAIYCSQRCGGLARSDRMRSQSSMAARARWGKA